MPNGSGTGQAEPSVNLPGRALMSHEQNDRAYCPARGVAAGANSARRLCRGMAGPPGTWAFVARPPKAVHLPRGSVPVLLIPGWKAPESLSTRSVFT